MGAIPINVTTERQLRKRGKAITNVAEPKGGAMEVRLLKIANGVWELMKDQS